MLFLGYLSNTASLCTNQLTIWMGKKLWIVKQVGMDNQFLSLILWVWPITLNELGKSLLWADVSPFKAVSLWHSLNNRKSVDWNISKQNKHIFWLSNTFLLKMKEYEILRGGLAGGDTTAMDYKSFQLYKHGFKSSLSKWQAKWGYWFPCSPIWLQQKLGTTMS